MNYQNYPNLMLLTSSDTKRKLIHLFLFTNSAQRELVSTAINFPFITPLLCLVSNENVYYVQFLMKMFTLSSFQYKCLLCLVSSINVYYVQFLMKMFTVSSFLVKMCVQRKWCNSSIHSINLRRQAIFNLKSSELSYPTNYLSGYLTLNHLNYPIQPTIYLGI